MFRLCYPTGPFITLRLTEDSEYGGQGICAGIDWPVKALFVSVGITLTFNLSVV